MFVLTFLLSLFSTFFSFALWIRNVSQTLDLNSGVIGLCIAFLMGRLLVKLPQIAGYPRAYMSGAFIGTVLILAPFVLLTYGLALVAAPYFLLWVGVNFLGFWTGK